METTTKERLREALDIRNLRPTDLSNKTGMTRGAISQYLSGKVNPKQDKIYIMAKALQVNPVWLMGKDVPMEESSLKNIFGSTSTNDSTTDTINTGTNNGTINSGTVNGDIINATSSDFVANPKICRMYQDLSSTSKEQINSLVKMLHNMERGK